MRRRTHAHINDDSATKALPYNILGILPEPTRRDKGVLAEARRRTQRCLNN